MFTKSLRSIRQISISYALCYNVHKSVSSPIRPTSSAVYFTYQIHQRLYCHQADRTLFDINLPPKSIVTNTNFYNITKRTESRSTSYLMKMLNYLPFFASGEIVSGFGRGSKELGIPTANYPLDVVKSLPDCFQPGVYYGWANVDNGPVYKMVMSIGWNPFYDNKEKSMETHILHEFNRDLYGCLLKICIVGYLRAELNFNCLDDLIVAIRNDITQAEDLLETNEIYKTLKTHQFFDANGSVGNDIQKSDADSKNVSS